jgi:hypothetical protein
MNVNRNYFETANARMAYVNGRLDGTLYKQILLYISNSYCSLKDYTSILEILESSYGDPNRVRNA